jgi:hypothetical protein
MSASDLYTTSGPQRRGTILCSEVMVVVVVSGQFVVNIFSTTAESMTFTPGHSTSPCDIADIWQILVGMFPISRTSLEQKQR